MPATASLEASNAGGCGPGEAVLALTRQTFEELFIEHRDAVWRYALRRVAHDDATDVVADTFLVAWRRSDDLPAEPLPWLLGIARKVIATKRRSAARRANLRARLQGELQGGPASAVDDRLELIEAFMSLSERDREVLTLVVWDGLDVQQAAAVIGCSPPSFSVRLHRARKRLQDRLPRDTRPFPLTASPEESR